MNRAAHLLRHAWLIVWNAALIALLIGAPAVALWQAGWTAVAFLPVLLVPVVLTRWPALALGAWFGGG
jgi:hypothetical protein